MKKILSLLLLLAAPSLQAYGTEFQHMTPHGDMEMMPHSGMGMMRDPMSLDDMPVHMQNHITEKAAEHGMTPDAFMEQKRAHMHNMSPEERREKMRAKRTRMQSMEYADLPSRMQDRIAKRAEHHGMTAEQAWNHQRTMTREQRQSQFKDRFSRMKGRSFHDLPEHMQGRISQRASRTGASATSLWKQRQSKMGSMSFEDMRNKRRNRQNKNGGMHPMRKKHSSHS